jgi:hypothetical protein
VWDLGWTKWHWGPVFSQYFGFLLSVMFLPIITWYKKPGPIKGHKRINKINHVGEMYGIKWIHVAQDGVLYIYNLLTFQV